MPGSGRRGLGGERSGGCDRRCGDRKRRGRLVGCWCRGRCRCRRCGAGMTTAMASAVTTAVHPALSRSDRLPGTRRRTMTALSRRILRLGLRRISLRFGAAGCSGLGVGIGFGIGIGLVARRVPCRCARWPRRCDHSNRCAQRGLVRCGSIVARAVVGCGLRIVGAARGGRVVLGAIVVVAGGRIAVDQRREAVVSGRWLGIRPGGPRRRGLERLFADTSDVTLTTGDPRAELSAIYSARTGPPAAARNINLFQ